MTGVAAMNEFGSRQDQDSLMRGVIAKAIPPRSCIFPVI